MSGLVFAAGRPWPQLLKSVLDQLDQLAGGQAGERAELGLVFLADPVTEMADLMLDGLRERTGIRTWFGAASTAVFAAGRELKGDGAIVALPLLLGNTRLHPFSGQPPAGAARATGGIVHVPDLADAASVLAAATGTVKAPLVGAQSASAFDHAQIALAPSAGAAAGVLFEGDIRLVTGVSHGCQPLGPAHKVTAGQGARVLRLDGRPATEILMAEAGELVLREQQPARQLLVAGLPGEGIEPVPLESLATLYGIAHADRHAGAIELSGLPQGASLPGRLAFHRRDPALALRELAELATRLRRMLGGRPPRAALFYSSTERGHGFFGPKVDEAAVLALALGPVPLIGMRSAAEVAGSRLTRYAAVLTLLA